MPAELINNDPFCDVRLAVLDHRGQTTDKFIVELADPAGEFKPLPGVGAVHSADYRLISNHQLRDAALEVMDKTGYRFEAVPSFGGGHSRPQTWTGSKYIERWYSKDVALDLPGKNAMMMGLEIRNSYDGSTAASMAFFAMRVACSNQFFATRMMGTPFQIAHLYSGDGDDFRETLGKVINRASTFATITPHVEKLRATKIRSFDAFLALRRNLVADTGVDFRDRQLLDELSGCGVTAELGITDAYTDDPSSYWALANAYTALTTHAVPAMRGADQGSRVVNWLLEKASTN